MTTYARDRYDQLNEPWTQTHYQIISILEEVADPDTNPDRTLAAYMTDILELTSMDICECGCNHPPAEQPPSQPLQN